MKTERPGTPVWSPDGSRFVYADGPVLREFVVDGQRQREVLSLRDLDNKASKVPEPERFTFANRRVREEALQWLPDGKRLLLSRGGDLFLADLATGQTGQLTATPVAEADPKLSPDGRLIAYRLDNELYTLDIASRRTKRLTTDATATRWNGRLDWVYPEELDLGTAYWWSPDSKRIAYLQFEAGREFVYPQTDLTKLRAQYEPQRYPHAGTPNADVRLGVLDVNRPQTRWVLSIAGETDLLARVQWTPDGRQLLAQRLPREQNRLDYLLIDADNGRTRTLLSETDPAWVNLGEDPVFLNHGQRLLITSERTGFAHLYTLDLPSGELRAVTSGNWLVDSLASVDEKNGWVYYTSTEPDPTQRQIWRIHLDGTGKQRLSREEGTHTLLLSPDGSHAVTTFSSLTVPPRRQLVRADGTVVAVLLPPDRTLSESYEIPPTEIRTYQDSSGRQFYARLMRPANFDPGRRYPAVVLVYGGPHAQNVRNAWPGITFDHLLAQQGYVVWQVDNRGTAGRGKAWETPLYRRFGKTELEDQVRGVEELVSLGVADKARIGITGWSYGGYMTLYALTNAPDVFRAGIAGAPVTDWRLYDTIYTERYMGLPQRNETGYRDASPVHQAGNLKARLMLVHNFEDDNVVVQNMMHMANALARQDKLFEMMVYPQKSHGVSGEYRRHMNRVMLDFFDRTLKQ